MVITCKTKETFKELIDKNRFCVVLVGSSGCNKCSGMIPVIETVYQKFPYITYMIVPERVIREYTRPLMVHATSVLFFKDGLRQSTIKRSKSPHSYEVHIKKMLKNDDR